MASHTGTGAARSASTVAGSAALALGILFTAAVAWTYVLSLDGTYNPPDGARVIGLVWLPLGFGGIPIAYYVARTGEGRHRGRLGVLIGLLGLVALVALVIAIG